MDLVAKLSISPRTVALWDPYDEEATEPYGSEKVFDFHFGEFTSTFSSFRDAKLAVLFVQEALELGREVFACRWVLEDVGFEGERHTFACGRPASADARGWVCTGGHEHVTAEARQAEGWDYFDADEIAAFRSGDAFAYTGVRDMEGREVR